MLGSFHQIHGFSSPIWVPTDRGKCSERGCGTIFPTPSRTTFKKREGGERRGHYFFDEANVASENVALCCTLPPASPSKKTKSGKWYFFDKVHVASEKMAKHRKKAPPWFVMVHVLITHVMCDWVWMGLNESCHVWVGYVSQSHASSSHHL